MHGSASNAKRIPDDGHRHMTRDYDVAVIGMGIVGLAHAFAAARAGKQVVVLDREASAIGASIRNFGFVTVTGQARGEMWELALRTRDIWAEVAPRAQIAIDQTGLTVFAHREEASAVLDALFKTEMGERCDQYTEPAYRQKFPDAPVASFRSCLVSPHELRIEPRKALPQLKDWLERDWGVEFRSQTNVAECRSGELLTPGGSVKAEVIFACPGDHLTGLFPDVLKRKDITRCKLQMMRLGPAGITLPTPYMADLSLVRYEGYAGLPESSALRERLLKERRAHLDAGVHLIVVQASDGSLVVGDSHDYGPSPDPFQRKDIDDLILSALDETLPGDFGQPTERWTGTYAWSPHQPWFTEEVDKDVHLTVITCGAGMSTAFAIAERVVSSALNCKLGALE